MCISIRLSKSLALGCFSLVNINAVTDTTKSVTNQFSNTRGASSKDDIQMFCGNEQPLYMLVNYLNYLA